MHELSRVLINIFIILIFIVGPFVLLAKLEQRMNTEGSILSGRPSRKMRVFALFLSILFTVTLFFYFELGILLAAIASFCYGIGLHEVYSMIEKRDNHSPITRKEPKSLKDYAPFTFGSLLQFVVVGLLVVSFLSAIFCVLFEIYPLFWVTLSCFFASFTLMVIKSLAGMKKEFILSVLKITFLIVTFLLIVYAFSPDAAASLFSIGALIAAVILGLLSFASNWIEDFRSIFPRKPRK